MGITIGREHLKDTTTKLQDGDIKSTTTEVEDGNLHVLIGLIDTIGQGGCCRLVDNTADIEACDGTCLLRGLTLRVAEVGRHGDDGIRHLLTKVVLGGLLHLLKHHGRNLLRRIFAIVNLHARIATLVDHRKRNALGLLAALVIGLTHETLDTVNGLLRVGDSLTLGRIAHLALATFYEAYHGRSRALALAVGDHHGLIALEHCYAAVSCT